MLNYVLTPDTQAVLLLCGTFGKKPEADVKPLSVAEYNRLAQWLHENAMRPADLLQPGRVLPDGNESGPSLDPPRVLSLLDRGGAMAIAVESWTNRGSWVLSRSDDLYPRRLKTRLGRAAPPLLYGAGDPALLSEGGLAVVGSREMDASAEDFAWRVGALAGRQGIALVSGGARGIDSTAMLTALEEGGRAVGVLSDSLEKAAVSGKYRPAVQKGALVLASPFEPSARFTVWRAMDRNKYVYALSDWALVVNASAETGGTRAGALENLKAKWVPVFVRADDEVPEGNRVLIREGGIPLRLSEMSQSINLHDWLEARAAHGTFTASENSELPTAEGDHSGAPQDQVSDGGAKLSPSGRPQEEIDLFEIIWPHMVRYLAIARGEKELAGLLALEPAQVRAWLKRGRDLGRVKKLSRPARFIAIEESAPADQLDLIG
ncbi:MAG: DNA-protecting protein DprA [Gemmatimonadetes bacterium]|jgi:predicted Rossmann fold nucleotide-binding protein DprA/Smf involved in DNA uptake|nr:DNA-protecting protein DprA [Gemmatimonadota bacterium]